MVRDRRANTLPGMLDAGILFVVVVAIVVGMLSFLDACSAAENKRLVRGVIELAPEACVLLDPGHPEVCTYLEDLRAIEPLLSARRAARDGGAPEGAADGASADAK